MTTTARQLSLNITSSATWTQAKALNDTGVYGSSSEYEAPPGGRATGSGFSVQNLSANTAVVNVAVSETGTVGYDAYIIYGLTLLTGERASIPDLYVIPSGLAVWVMVVGTSPDIIFQSAILEVIP